MPDSVKAKSLKEKDAGKILVEKLIIFALFSFICSYFIYPNLLVGLTLTEIFTFIALCPRPMVFGKDKEKLNEGIIYLVGAILLIVALSSAGFSLPLLMALMFFIIASISIKTVHLGTHWLAMVLAPILSFIAIECGRGLGPQILGDVKSVFGGSEAAISEAAVSLLPYIVSVFSLYIVLNLIIMLSKDRRIGLLIFGSIISIVCFLNLLAVIVTNKPFDIGEISPLIEAVKAVEDWKALLSVERLISFDVLSFVIFVFVYFAVIGSLANNLVFVTKKEKSLRILFLVFSVISVILYLRQQEIPVTEAERLNTFLFTLL